MNHIFSPYISRFLDVYLDDIIIYSDSFEEHIKHVKISIDVLRREWLYLSLKKLHFLEDEIRLLGRIVGKDGIRMDPAKVDSVVAWKTPTNCDLLRGFLGAVGYLADDLAAVQIPMAVLHGLTGDTVPFRWEYTHQRAFEDVKHIVEKGRHHKQVPLRYGPNVDPIFLITDGCAMGIAGVVSQGRDWRSAKVAAFFSAKLNSAQQNYPVHEIEMLAGVETMLRHHDILQGVKFKWITDHKGLMHLLMQKDLSGRQARWVEKISSFAFDIVYIPGVENVLADALSRMYSEDAPGTVRARSEYTYHDVVDNDICLMHAVSMPLLTGAEAVSVSRRPHVEEIPDEDDHNFVREPPDEQKEGARGGKQSPELLERTTKLTIKIPPCKQIEKHEQERFTIKIPAQKPKPITESTAEVADMTPVEEKDNAQSLLNVVATGCEGVDFPKILQGRYHEDSFFKTILENPKHYKNFVVETGLVYIKMNDRNLLCIPKLYLQGRNIREIVISEAHSLLAHLGANKTLAYLQD